MENSDRSARPHCLRRRDQSPRARYNPFVLARPFIPAHQRFADHAARANGRFRVAVFQLSKTDLGRKAVCRRTHQFRSRAAHSCANAVNIGTAWPRHRKQHPTVIVGLARYPPTVVEGFSVTVRLSLGEAEWPRATQQAPKRPVGFLKVAPSRPLKIATSLL